MIGQPLPTGRGLGRRRFLRTSAVALGLAATSGVLAACGDGGKGGSGSAAAGELLVWYWGEQEAAGMKRFFEGTVDEYNKAGSDKGGKARAVLQESDSLYTAFRTAAKAKKGPDVQFFWGSTQALEDVWAGRVAPLDGVLSKDRIESANKDVRRETPAAPSPWSTTTACTCSSSGWWTAGTGSVCPSRRTV